MVNVEIDGKLVQAVPGTTVIEAAQQADVYIPHFCYHKKLSLAASCRMCLVEVEKMPRPVPACVTPIAEGMKVHTHSPMAVKAQKGVMEFLLINHPLDCPICDQGGECSLQDLAVGYGGNASRYTEEKRIVEGKEVGELISTKEMSRCIHCTRCVRFGQEVGGIMEMGMANRSEFAEIMTFLDSSIDSELSGNMIDLCPVGALTSKPFRYTARNWELSRRRSVSPYDSLGANLAIHVKNNQVMRVTPIENEDINECWISDKDRFSYEGLNSADRLTKPMIKQGGKWQETDWQTALEYVANGLRQISNNTDVDQIAALAAPNSTVEELYLLQKFMRGMGSSNVDSRPRQSDFALDGKQAGAPWLGMPIAELSKADRFLVIGAFLRKDQPLLAQRIRQAAKKGAQVNVLHAANDDLLMPIANTLIVTPAEMVNKAAQVLKALAILKQQSLDASWDEVINAVQIGATAQAMAASLASGQNAVVLLGNYAQQHPEYSQLALIAGEIARLSGARLGVLGEAANSVGGFVAGAVPFGSGHLGMNAAQMFDSPRKAYLLLNIEPELDCQNPQQAMTALSAADMVVVMSPYKYGMDYADVLLPVAPFTETSGTYISTEGRVQSFKGAVKPLGETRPAWKVIRVLANLLNVSGFAYETSEQARDELLAVKIIDNALNNRISGLAPQLTSAVNNGLQRVADVPIYFTDSMVRRATALQKTADAQMPCAEMNPEELACRGLSCGDVVTIKQGNGQAVLKVKASKAMPLGTVRIAAAHAATSKLASMFGSVELTAGGTLQPSAVNTADNKVVEQA